jgi:hypothetical protein
LPWWQRAAKRIAEKARSLAVTLLQKARDYWQGREPDNNPERGRDDDGGRER